MLAEWMVHMYLSDLSAKTSRLYLDVVAGLYHKAAAARRIPEAGAFKDFRSLLKNQPENECGHRITRADLDRCISLTREAPAMSGEMALAADIVLFSLLNRAMPLAEIAMLRRRDLDAYSEESNAVAARHTSARRAYVFPLNQSENTPKTTARRISELVRRLFSIKGIPFTGDADSTLRTIWACGALRLGVTASEVRTLLGDALPDIPCIDMCAPENLPDTCVTAITRSVGQLFYENPLRWFAMRLRPGVKFDDITRRFGQISDEITIPETFYPYEEIARRTGRKLVFEQKPVIADVVFFRSPITGVLPLFARIGDLAWCYTTTGRPGAPYAPIPNSAFINFQKTIGQFTPDYEVAPLGGLEPRAHDRVVVVGGLFHGMDGEFRDITHNPSDATAIYRINLTGTNGIEWRISLDPRLVTAAK